MTSNVQESQSLRMPTVLSVLAVLVWGGLMGAYKDADPYVGLGLYALLVVGIIGVRYRDAVRQWLRPTTLGVATGAGMGVLMVALTYPAFALATELVPALRPMVDDLYRATQRPDPLVIMPSVLIIVVAEELLWRGALLRLWRGRPWVGAALSVLTYTLAQACTGSVVVALLALACGTIWTVQRRLTGSLLSPLVAHLIWTPTVLVFCPVTQL